MRLSLSRRPAPAFEPLEARVLLSADLIGDEPVAPLETLVSQQAIVMDLHVVPDTGAFRRRWHHQSFLVCLCGSFAGDYRIYATYNTVPYQIRNGGILLDTVYVNQIVEGSRWNLLGVYTFTGTASVTILSDLTPDFSTNADAVRFVPVL